MKLRTQMQSLAVSVVVLVSTAFAANNGSARITMENRRLGISIPSVAQAVGTSAAPTANSNPHGAPYGEWGARWWQWVFSLKVHGSDPNVETHPLLTTGAVDCAQGQSGTVSFLAGNFLTGGSSFRSCTVPRGIALFAPVLNAWCDNVGYDAPTNLTVPQLQTCAAGFAAPLPGSLHASVDGVSVPLSPANRGVAVFEYAVPNTDNLLQYLGAQAPGPGWPYGITPLATHVAPAASDGSWIMIEPLSPGVHAVNFGGTTLGGFLLDVTYALTIN